MSGISCADKLAAAGVDVEVFDKGRALGGRLSTRFSDDLAFNHGAPDFEVNGHAFTSFIEQLVAHGSAARKNPKSAWFYGKPHMNCLLEPLAATIRVHQTVEITAVSRVRQYWSVASKNGQSFGPFDAVVACIPAPQARQLIQTIKTGWAKKLNAVRYDPCLTIMIAYGGELPGIQSASFEGHAALAQQIRQSPGNQRASTGHASWVVHAASNWSRDHLERGREDISQRLLNEFNSANRLTHLEPTFLRGHRWRYARVSRSLGLPYLWDAEVRIGLAGDWCIGANVEDAYNSGSNLAERMLETVI